MILLFLSLPLPHLPKDIIIIVIELSRKVVVVVGILILILLIVEDFQWILLLILSLLKLLALLTDWILNAEGPQWYLPWIPWNLLLLLIVKLMNLEGRCILSKCKPSLIWLNVAAIHSVFELLMLCILLAPVAKRHAAVWVMFQFHRVRGRLTKKWRWVCCVFF